MHEQLQTLPSAARAKLGEELPIFCEKCGYSLHGLPQKRCDHCTILQYECPECGHHQPLNTLRPAFQNMLGRIRATWLGMWVAGLSIAFLLLLFAWAGMGVEWAFRWSSRGGSGYSQSHRSLSTEMLVGFGVFGTIYGLFWRMMLLRWRRGALVGAVLATLVFAATLTGVWIEWTGQNVGDRTESMLGAGLLLATGFGCCCVVIAATLAWTIWTGLVRAFLPKRAAAALLDWQISLSHRSASDLANDPVAKGKSTDHAVSP